MVYDGRSFAMCYHLAVELGRPCDHECCGWTRAGDCKAVRVIPRHEDKAARPGGPAVLTAVAGELTREQVKHFVLAGMRVRAD